MRILFSTAVFVLIFHVLSIAQDYDGKPIQKWWLAGADTMKLNNGKAPELPVIEKFFNDSISEVKLFKGKPAGPLVVHSKQLKWFPYTSTTYQVDFDSIFKRPDYACAYAVTEVRATSNHTAYLAVGSDDAIKVWLNGKLVHNMFVARGLVADNDLIPLALEKGSNVLLIQVMDGEGGWGLTARFLDKQGLTAMLGKAVATGNIDEAEDLMKAGADIKDKGKLPYTPVILAKLKGREEMVKLLVSRGAKDENPDAPETLINTLYDSLKGKPYPAISVLVAQNGKVLYMNAFGYADIEKKVVANPLTKFRIGSITKQFTASGILKLKEQGKLQLTDKLSKYFPDFPRGNEVTIHHLLTHTSGIHSYTNTDSFLNRVTQAVTNEELLKYFKNIPYDFDPGERLLYNNSGYFLLGYIIEKLSGKRLATYLKETFFDPLQMTNTGVYDATARPENEAIGYQGNGNNNFTRALDWNMTWAGGAGALYSTVEDLYKWNEAIFSGKVLSEESRKLAFTPVTLNNGKKAPEMSYGYGWGINQFRGQQVIEHGGGLHGFISQLARYTGENMTIVMLSNATPSQVEISSNKLAEFYLWQKLDKQKSFSVSSVSTDSMNLADYVGGYNFQQLGIMKITREENKLFAQLGTQPRFEIFASGKDEFYWKVVPAKIKFIRDEQGKVISGDFEQGGAKLNVPKVD